MSTKSTGERLQFPSLVAAGVVAFTSIVLVAFRFWSFSTTPKVKILLQDEIKSARQRALEYCFNPRAVMAKGYAKFKNEVFGLDTQDGVKLVIPPSFLDELKSHPALSFKVSIDNDMQIEYTHFGGPAEYVIHAIKAKLTGSLYWTPVKVHDRVLRLIATNNARVFQGTAASIDEEWLAASTGYVLACFDCIRALKQWHPWLRPLVYRIIPERAAIKDQWLKGRKRVMASMRERHEKGGNLEDPPTMLDHLSNGRNEHIADDVELQLLHQMTLIAVGTVTTFSSTTQAIYDLVAHPEYIPILREEVESVPRDQNGNFTKDSTVAMDKLDSFLKESQRFNSPDLTTFQRAAIADMKLPDGTFVPKGTKLEINTCSIHKDHELYENPEEFDGLRFHKWRKAPGKEKKYMYSSSGTDDLSWGYGRHACPGRYLSAINIKLIMAELLMNYDIKLPDGVSRPKNIEFEVLCSPEPDFEILLKDRIIG
ncbi:ent-kaurene oxidase [Fusarium subglutinans]|uniref:Ent-kaurene oxidase n=1 Tax=Gibberella subglutinans TaxID=42677 RepID=A0A8H5QDJ8_GIBSU|nr:ent-kaurene oxidase [Fusarium subglutinans]KAF5611946.1 ent-kaurene oxidase [Fusarium subglutinans]